MADWQLWALTLLAVVFAYFLGRIDGYFKCAEEQEKLEAAWGDSDRVDWLDKQCSPVVEGQTVTWPYGEHVANSWSVTEQCSNVREAIDKASGKNLY